jgi:hypothetical protein
MTIYQNALAVFTRLPKDLRDRGQELMWALEDPATALDTFMDEANKELEQRKDQDHTDALLECRKQDKVIAEIEQEIYSCEIQRQKDENAIQTAVSAVTAAKNARPSRFPLKEELAAWEKSVARAERIYDEKEAQARLSGSRPASLRNDLQRARALLQELSEKEFNLRPKQEAQGTVVRSSIAANPFGLQG